MEKELEIKEGTNLKVDVKTIVALSLGLLSLASVYFTLIGEISQLKLDLSRTESDLEMNSEFRIKWPRGELGALPDDAEQNLRLQYLEKHQEVLLYEVDVLQLKIKEFENCR